MKRQAIYFVGTQDEVAHHAAPLLGLPSAERIEFEIVDPTAVVQRAASGDLAVFFSEHFDRFRTACEQLKQRNVATLYMIDGILEWRNAWENRTDEPACPWTMRPVLAHKVACIGSSQARVLADWGNGPKIEVTGVPRFDSLVNRWKKPTSDSATKKSATETAPFRILIMTAKFPGFTPEQTENARRALSDLKDYFDSNSTIGSRPVEIVWRLTRSMHEQVGVSNKLDDLSGNELHQTLESVDAVITTPSTAMVEAMLMRLPVVLLEYNRNPHYVPAAWHIGNRDDIGDVVEQLADPPPIRMQFQNDVLLDTLAIDNEQSASARMADLIRKMLAHAATWTDSAGELRFPARILDPVCPLRPGFDHSQIFAGYDGFDTADTIELQSREAHSRREITYLQSEVNRIESVITGLKSELNEAHQIFDQIHCHPIAGPVVRARQKLIDWLSRFKQREGQQPEDQQSDSQPGKADND